jgi:PGF-pre-PGF domain-containing protein
MLKTKQLVLLLSVLVIIGTLMTSSALAEQKNEKISSVYGIPEQTWASETFKIDIAKDFIVQAADAYEPDNNSTNATWITPNGTPQVRTIDPAGDQDWLKFDATENTSYIIITQNTSTTTDTYLRLKDADGTTLLGYNDDINYTARNYNSQIIWFCHTNGTYYVQVQNATRTTIGGYNISVNVTSLSGYSKDIYEVDNNFTLATWIETNKTIQNHSFSPYTNDEDWVKFNVTNNTWYVVETLNLTNGTDSRLYVYTDGVTALNNATKDDDIAYPYNLNSRVFFKANANGTFYARNWDYWTKAGNYSLFVYQPNFSQLYTNNTPFPVSLNFQNNTAYLKFNATNGTIYSIYTQNATTGVDTYVRLYHGNGTPLSENDDISYPSNLNSRIVFDCKENGTYSILASTYKGGQFNISISVVGKLIVNWLKPISEMNVTQNATFQIITGIQCVGGVCGNITATLDPDKTDEKYSGEEKIFEETKELPEIITEKAIGDTYIVLLKNNGIPKFTTSNAENVKEKIKETQQNFIASHSNLKVKMVYSTINALAIQASLDEIQALANDTNILSIEPDRVFHLELSESAPQIKANMVWNQTYNGVNLTGKYQTVCILDTGVNYSHPALSSSYLGGYDFAYDDADPMDDDGHGTHVSGIVTSDNDTYRGIAPDAGLIMIKVFDSGGNAYTSDIIAGIDWCTDNKTTFNISVISMSLGTNTYWWNNATKCESDNPSLTSIINTATSAGITVVAASGNDYKSNNISAPGCIKNVISVGSVEDGSGGTTLDQISSFSNTAPILSILAPGDEITSTSLRGGSTCTSGGDFGECGGTSMATPHVAGAIAVMNQLYKAKYGTNLNKTQALYYLNTTGKKINDTRNGINFSRVDLYEAVNALGTKGIISMTNGAKPFYTTTQNPRYPANLTCMRNMVDGGTCNITWTVNATGALDSVWEFYTIFASEYGITNETAHLNITISSQNMAPQITINSPANNTLQNPNILVNATIFSNTSLIKVANFRYENSTYNSSWFTMTENDSTNNLWYYSFNATNLADGNYTIRVHANNSLGTSNESAVIIILDRSPPIVNIISTYPQNTDTPLLNYTVIEATLNTTWYVLDNGTPAVITGNQTFSLSYPGLHTITVYANDTSGNNGSSTRIFSENFPMNMTNWTTELINYAPELTNVTVTLFGNDITNNESVEVSGTMNITLQTANFNLTIRDFHGLNASWFNFFDISENDVNVNKSIISAGLSAVKLTSLINVSNFLSDGRYNGTIEFSPNATGFNVIFYCPTVSSTFADTGVTGGNCSIPVGHIGGCYNTTTCYNIAACSGNYNGTPCYVNSASTMKAYVPHFSAVAGANDTEAPQLTINSPTNKTYTNNTEVSNLNANLTASSDTTTCYASLKGGANNTMTKNNLIFSSSLGSPLLNGGYNISFYCKDAYNHWGSALVYFTMNDTTKPTMSMIESNLDTDSVDIDTTTDESVFGVVFYAQGSNADDYVNDVTESNCHSWTDYNSSSTINDEWDNHWLNSSSFCDGSANCDIKVLSPTSKTKSPSIHLSGLNDETHYYYGACMCDIQGNCKLLQSDFTTETTNTSNDDEGAGGGGGGGGNNTTVQTAKITGIWTEIVANEKQTWNLNSNLIPIKTIEFTLKETLIDLVMSVTNLGTNSGGLVAPPNLVYSYIKIDPGAAYSAVTSAKIKFQIPSSWFASNSADKEKVKLYRYIGSQWYSLYTRVISTSGSTYTYEADSPGFSYFAITAEQGVAPVNTSQTSITATLNKSQTATYTLQNNPYVVKVVDITNDSKAKLEVNGEQTTLLAEGQSYKFTFNANMTVSDVNYVQNGTGNVTFTLAIIPILVSQNTSVTAQQVNMTCGDNVCSSNETCGSCSKDCGTCQPKGTSITDQISGFFGVYWLYIVVAIISVSVAGVLYYIFVVRGIKVGIQIHRGPKEEQKRLVEYEKTKKGKTKKGKEVVKEEPEEKQKFSIFKKKEKRELEDKYKREKEPGIFKLD